MNLFVHLLVNVFDEYEPIPEIIGEFFLLEQKKTRERKGVGHRFNLSLARIIKTAMLKYNFFQVLNPQTKGTLIKHLMLCF